MIFVEPQVLTLLNTGFRPLKKVEEYGIVCIHHQFADNIIKEIVEVQQKRNGAQNWAVMNSCIKMIAGSSMAI